MKSKTTHARTLAPALLLGVVVLFALNSANAQNPPSTNPNEQQQPGAAYQDGFELGKADAQSSMPSYGQPSDQWTTVETRSAYSQGYGAGYAQGSSTTASPYGNSTIVDSGVTQPVSRAAERFGYEDGHAAGQKDLNAGNAFRPADGEMYKKADRGWTPRLGDKDQYQQTYRESFARGYQEGYGNSPTTY
jgi:hypothetical protein